MTSSLFRPQALEFQKEQREFGHVGRLQSTSLKVLSWSLTAAVAFFILFICVAGYTRKETVAGYLAPTMGTAKIFVPQHGTVTEVDVSEDQPVAKGDILLTIDTAQIAADGLDVNAAVLKSLAVQKLVLTTQIDAEDSRARAEKDRLAAAISSGEAELAQLSSQIGFQEEQIELAQKDVDVATEMHSKGYLSAPELFKRQEGLLEAQKTLSSLRQQYSARETELSKTRYTLAQLPVDSARTLQPLKTELSQIEQRTAEVSGRRSFAVRAPIAGRVATVQTKVGQIADPKTLQLEIIPFESALQAKLFVPTRAIGFIRPGQKVRLLYDAFPFQRFGTYSGRVLSVSKTILSEGDLSAPVQPKEPTYEVIAALDRQDVDVSDQKMPLKPGMMLQADILLEKRELVRWLLDPILKVRM